METEPQMPLINCNSHLQLKAHIQSSLRLSIHDKDASSGSSCFADDINAPTKLSASPINP